MAEVQILFKQVVYENLQQHAYNEENVALRQAAILEVLQLLEERKG